MENRPTKEQLEYRKSEEFCNHDFGRWSLDGVSIMSIDPVTGERHETNYTPEDERIIAKAGYTMDDLDWLIQNSPKAKRNKIIYEAICKEIDAKVEFNRKHKFQRFFLFLISTILCVLFLPLLLLHVLFIKFQTARRYIWWIYQFIISSPFRLLGKQGFEYNFNLDPCPWKIKTDNIGDDDDDDDDIDYEYWEEVFQKSFMEEIAKSEP